MQYHKIQKSSSAINNSILSKSCCCFFEGCAFLFCLWSYKWSFKLHYFQTISKFLLFILFALGFWRRQNTKKRIFYSVFLFFDSTLMFDSFPKTTLNCLFSKQRMEKIFFFFGLNGKNYMNEWKFNSIFCTYIEYLNISPTTEAAAI